MNKFIFEFSLIIYSCMIVGLLYMNKETITPKIARSIVFWPITMFSELLKMIAFIIVNLIALFLLVINLDIRESKWYKIIDELI